MPLLGWNFLCCLFLCFLSGLKVLNLLWLLHKSARHSIVFTRAGRNKLKLDFNIVRSDVTDCLFSGKKFEIVRCNEKAIVAFAYRKQKVSVIQCWLIAFDLSKQIPEYKIKYQSIGIQNTQAN